MHASIGLLVHEDAVIYTYNLRSRSYQIDFWTDAKFPQPFPIGADTDLLRAVSCRRIGSGGSGLGLWLQSNGYHYLPCPLCPCGDYLRIP